jgi:hypothetical protein
VVAEHVVVKCPYVPNEIKEKIAFLNDQMKELLESTELYGGEDNENLESRAIAQATWTEERTEPPTQDLEQGYDPGEGPLTLNTEGMVVLSDDVPMQQLVDTKPHQDFRGQGFPCGIPRRGQLGWNTLSSTTKTINITSQNNPSH